MSNEKICESCGMPMRTKEEFGGSIEGNNNCVHCCDEQGKLKPYDQVLEGMKNFMIKTMGITEEEALKSAKEHMAKMPAWKNAG